MVEGSVSREFFGATLATFGFVVAFAVSSFFDAWILKKYKDPVKAKGIYALVAVATYIITVFILYQFFFTPEVAAPPKLKVLQEEAEELADVKREERRVEKEEQKKKLQNSNE